MADAPKCLYTELCGVGMNTPVIGASGTYGFGYEYENIVDMAWVGAVSGKGLTLEGKAGNEGERLFETPSGLINSIGLQNPGVRHFIEHELPAMRALGPAVMANLGGSTVETYEEGARLLDAADVDFIELNISCPNVKAGGIAYGVKAESAREVVSHVRKCTKKPLIVKLSPNAENITEMALACEEAGADGLSLVNTFPGDGHRHRKAPARVRQCVRGAVRPGHPAHRAAHGVPGVQSGACARGWAWAALRRPRTRSRSSWRAPRPCRWARRTLPIPAPARTSPAAWPRGWTRTA